VSEPESTPAEPRAVSAPQSSPVSDPVTTSTAAAQASPGAETKAGGAGPEAVAGERLGVPFDATRAIADYGRPRPSYVFLALLSAATLALDVASKGWAEHHLEGYPGTVEVWRNHLTLLLAKNRGGAWGLLQSTSENVRRPFFLLVSVAAIAFIMTLYRRLQPRQHALMWGLPLVLGGALGNVFDRIRYGHVIDFVDAHIVYKGIDRHWPTFNVADIAICVGVGLMALDMFTSKRAAERPPVERSSHVPPAQSGEPSPEWAGTPGGTSAFGGGVVSPGGLPVAEGPDRLAEGPRAIEPSKK
jgi:signal peptidase II